MSNTPPTITAKLHESGYTMADANFYSIQLASDGYLYYTLSTHNIDYHGRVFRYDPKSEAIEFLGDLGEIVGEAGKKSIPQGKSHTPFFEMDSKLYFATHYGFYKPSSDREEPAEVPQGYTQYPGGHFVELDMRSGEFKDLAKARVGEGIIAMNIDRCRRRLYGLTWPSGEFVYYEMDSGEMVNVGPVSRGGEIGLGDQYFCLCRSIGVVPQTGVVYLTNPNGEILKFDPEAGEVVVIEESLDRPMLGTWDPHTPGHQGYNWRNVLWHEQEEAFYGVHGKSGYLFVFDPKTEKLDLIERICVESLRKRGEFEPFRYGYLSLELAADGETFYYLTGTGWFSPNDDDQKESYVHLVTYNKRTGDYKDHGRIVLEDGRHPVLPQTLAIGGNGRLYSCPWIEKRERKDGEPVFQCDLISFGDPLWEG